MSAKSRTSKDSLNGDDVKNGSDTGSTHSSQQIKLDEHAPRPRLCHLKKWHNFNGYGFNLHAERAKMGQHIGKVDSESPAESAGLREGDRIIEVNFVNISNENHQQVVRRIRNGLELDGKLYEDQVALLVVDKNADEYYRNLGIVIKSDFPNVMKLTTATLSPIANDVDTNNNTNSTSNGNKTLTDKTNNDQKSVNGADSSNNNDKLVSNSASSIAKSLNEEDNASNSSRLNNSTNRNNSTSSSIHQQQNTTSHSPTDNHSNSSKVVDSTLVQSKINLENKNTANKSSMPSTTTSSKSSAHTSTNSNVSNGHSTNSTIDPYQMSAAEFKNYLKSKGRADPRIAPVDIKQKFQIFQDM